MTKACIKKKCTVIGCNGLGNTNKKFKSHRSLSTCPNFKKRPTIKKQKVLNSIKNNDMIHEELERINQNLEIKLRDCQTKLRESENLRFIFRDNIT